MSDKKRDEIITALTIAGTDPCGGAGINVDLQVFRDFGVHGAAVITAVVWQNTQGVRGWRELEPEDLRDQLFAVAEDFPLHAIKIGMVPTGDLMIGVRHFLHGFGTGIPVILDPVMASGRGHRSLMAPTGHRGLYQLSRYVDLITPNGPEARMMVSNSREMKPVELVEALLEAGWRRVLLTGGHLREENAREVVDYYGDEKGVKMLAPLPVVDKEVRGTGCQLSSAIAAQMARGADWPEAIEGARQYLNELLTRQAKALGQGAQVVIRTDDRDQGSRR